jgi:hypothetical protein
VTWVPHMSGRIWIATFFAAVALTSCSDEQEQQEKTLRGILSWTASAEFIIDERLRGTVPKAFSQLAIERCREEVALLKEDLVGSSLEQVGELQSHLDHATEAANKDNRSAARPAILALREARSQISAGMSKP